MKTVLITGGSRGIGAAAARRFAEGGYRVAINYLKSETQAKTLAEHIGGIPLQGDISCRAQAQDVVSRALSSLGGIDCLVCNAGIAQQALFPDVTEEDWRRMFAVHVDGVFHTVQAVLPHMISHKAGRIVTLSSMWGVTGGSCEVSYSAAKAAVIGMTKALAKELGPSGIAVNCVAPGVIATDMNAALNEESLQTLREETPLGRIGTAEDVAESIYFLGSTARFMTGQVLSPNGGIVI
ncbi:MAG: SDR family oxidoreductase [Oscillospiraceae bacterium]|nr:SDR family oxidoreductase [Oscillospiraceae bacterium]